MAGELFVIEAAPGADGDAKGEASIVIRVRVQAGAGKAAVVGRDKDELTVRVAPPFFEDRANAAVTEVLSDLFGTTPDAVELVSGQRSAAKRLRVRDVDPHVARRLLADALLDRSQGSKPSRRGGRYSR